MKLCRFLNAQNEPRVGLFSDEQITEVTGNLSSLLEATNPPSGKSYPAKNVRLLAPIERHEVWAAGVTYLRSKKARMEESNFSATAYDRVYEADRPELFFKSMPEKVAGPGQEIGIRKDGKWNVPEPELALVLNAKGRIVGYTIGNDMSSRDIEGENLLYLPQAKIYKHSCALGPVIVTGVSEEEARTWTIRLEIRRAGKTVFEGNTSVSNIRRKFQDLADYLFRSQEFPNGAVLLTGTGIVPPDDFTLQLGDTVKIEISGIGILENRVVIV
ncbi:MAG TPA: fumarylacetoacetate hydrolase family protein [Verrucomicrobiae bacterium]|nr:fumarylacetoacetate hydrolase family protein [Verrucomicrobiae bacterium]